MIDACRVCGGAHVGQWHCGLCYAFPKAPETLCAAHAPSPELLAIIEKLQAGDE